MNIFENQVIPIGIHNLSKKFRPNLATVRVLSLGMKFIPKTQSLKWKQVFHILRILGEKWTKKCFFFVEKKPGTCVRNKAFGMKSSWNCLEEYKHVNNFCFNVRDRLDGISNKQWVRKGHKICPTKKKRQWDYYNVIKTLI